MHTPIPLHFSHLYLKLGPATYQIKIKIENKFKISEEQYRSKLVSHCSDCNVMNVFYL